MFLGLNLSDIPDMFIVCMVKDLEDTREKYQGYSYVTTMRNILIGKPDAAIAPYFKDKFYHGVTDKLSKENLEIKLESLVKMGFLDYVISEKGKKLYCTHDYHDMICMKL